MTHHEEHHSRHHEHTQDASCCQNIREESASDSNEEDRGGEQEEEKVSVSKTITEEKQEPVGAGLWEKIRKTRTFSVRPLEAIGAFALIIWFFNIFFQFSLTVEKRSWFAGTSGSKAQATQSSQSVSSNSSSSANAPSSALEEKILPKNGVTLPLKWGELGKKMVESGVIDKKKFLDLYANRGGIPDDMKKLLEENVDKKIVMTEENAPILLNLLWALGLGQKNDILTKGPMSDPQYGGAEGFASTGGWPLSAGKTMDHFSKYEYFTLTPEQQKRVEEVSKNIYRPCCGNSTYFPDCNHGMAMLGLLELLASQNVSEEQMYTTALAVNSYWFPDTYLAIGQYLENTGSKWEDVNAKEKLGAAMSSAQGFQQIQAQVKPPERKSGGGGCGA